MILGGLDFELADWVVLCTSRRAIARQEAQSHWPRDVDFNEDDRIVTPTLLLLAAWLSTDLFLEAKDDVLQVLIFRGCLIIQPVDAVEPASCSS